MYSPVCDPFAVPLIPPIFRFSVEAVPVNIPLNESAASDLNKDAPLIPSTFSESAAFAVLPKY